MDLNSVNLELKRLELLQKELAELISQNDYLSGEYNIDEVNKSIEQCEIELSNILLEEVKNVIEGKRITGLGTKDIYKLLDLSVYQMQSKILSDRKYTFDKYKKLNEEIKREATIIANSLNSKASVYSESFNNRLDNASSMEELLNNACLATFGLPFMVALLVNEPQTVYNAILDTLNCNFEDMSSIRKYIENQKRMLDSNLVLSDTTLVNLLESATGKNILAQEEINRRNSIYESIANQFCQIIYGMDLLSALTKYKPEDIVGKIEDLYYNKKIDFNLNIKDINNLKIYIYTTFRYLNSEINKANGNIAIKRSDGMYDIRPSYGDGINIYSGCGREIKPFMDDSSLSFDLDGNPIEHNIGSFICSENISIEYRRNIIRTIISNLKLCKSMFDNYYMSDDIAIRPTIEMTNGVSYLYNQPLDEYNINHLLGVIKTNRDNKKLIPDETLRMLFGRTNVYKSAKDVLEAILDHEDDLIDAGGCFRGEDGILHELLPWGKFLLKTNAFVRGDIFKSSSIIVSLNPNSFLINAHELINLLSLTGTAFRKSPVNQELVSLCKDENGRLKFGQYDMVVKGMVASRNGRSISRRTGTSFSIDQVVTNESFIGERLRTSNGGVISTMNKLDYIAKEIDPESGSLIEKVDSDNNIQSEKSIAELAEQIVIASTTIPYHPNFIALCNNLTFQLGNLVNKRNYTIDGPTLTKKR